MLIWGLLRENFQETPDQVNGCDLIAIRGVPGGPRLDFRACIHYKCRSDSYFRRTGMAAPKRTQAETGKTASSAAKSRKTNVKPKSADSSESLNPTTKPVKSKVATGKKASAAKGAGTSTGDNITRKTASSPTLKKTTRKAVAKKPAVEKTVTKQAAAKPAASSAAKGAGTSAGGNITGKAASRPTLKKTTRKAVAKKPAVKKTVTKRAAAKLAASSTQAAQDKTAKKNAKSPSAFSDAVKLYESGFKLMHAEKFDKAGDTFAALVEDFPEETGLLDRAHVLIHVCQKRIRESKKSMKLKSADDYYEVGVAEMNRRELDDALEHLQQALRMSPRADHVFYALAAVSALRNERDEALEYLEKSIKYRDENRFLAINDVDFESLSDDPEFIQLITPDEG